VAHTTIRPGRIDSRGWAVCSSSGACWPLPRRGRQAIGRGSTPLGRGAHRDRVDGGSRSARHLREGGAEVREGLRAAIHRGKKTQAVTGAEADRSAGCRGSRDFVTVRASQQARTAASGSGSGTFRWRASDVLFVFVVCFCGERLAAPRHVSRGNFLRVLRGDRRRGLGRAPTRPPHPRTYSVVEAPPHGARFLRVVAIRVRPFAQASGEQ